MKGITLIDGICLYKKTRVQIPQLDVAGFDPRLPLFKINNLKFAFTVLPNNYPVKRNLNLPGPILAFDASNSAFQ